MDVAGRLLRAVLIFVCLLTPSQGRALGNPARLRVLDTSAGIRGASSASGTFTYATTVSRGTTSLRVTPVWTAGTRARVETGFPVCVVLPVYVEWPLACVVHGLSWGPS